MKKIIGLLAILTSIFVGACEEEDSSSSNDYLFNDTSTVVRLNDTSSGHAAIKIVEDADGNHLYITSDTIIWKERDSGSGFSSGSVSSIGIGKKIKYYYNMDDVDFRSNPTIFYVIELYVYL